MKSCTRLIISRYTTLTPTIDECAEAVYNMKLNKSPGLDGIPIEFYKMFWKRIKLYIYESLVRSFEVGELSSSQRASVLSLIHKKGTPLNLDNYRPISLTNCDYKILAFVFAKRLQTIMNKLINVKNNNWLTRRCKMSRGIRQGYLSLL